MYIYRRKKYNIMTIYWNLCRDMAFISLIKVNSKLQSKRDAMIMRKIVLPCSLPVVLMGKSFVDRWNVINPRCQSKICVTCVWFEIQQGMLLVKCNNYSVLLQRIVINQNKIVRDCVQILAYHCVMRSTGKVTNLLAIAKFYTPIDAMA